MVFNYYECCSHIQITLLPNDWQQVVTDIFNSSMFCHVFGLANIILGHIYNYFYFSVIFIF
jgi:hypothetical protein